MRIATLIAGAVMALGIATVSTPSVAAPIVPKVSVTVDTGSDVVQVRHNRHHWRDHHWRGPRIIIGPSYEYGYGHRYGRCRHVRRSCGYDYGWGTRSFYRCVDRRGC